MGMVGAARVLSVSFRERSEGDALDGEIKLEGDFDITEQSRLMES